MALSLTWSWQANWPKPLSVGSTYRAAFELNVFSAGVAEVRGVELIIDHQLEAANLLQEGRCQDIAAFLLGREVQHLIGTKRCKIGRTAAPLLWDLAGAAARPERLVQLHA